MRRRALLAGLALAAGTARADPASEPPTDQLRVSWQDRLNTLDPYRTALRTGLMLAHELFDCLIDRDPETFQLRPLLAASWRQEDDHTLAFQLRADVTFHDGSPFGAEDVVATIRTVLSDPELGIPTNYDWLAGAQANGDHEVRLKLANPFPAAAQYVAAVLPILPRDVATASRRAELAASPIGTGPYRLRSVDPDGTLRLAAFAGSPKGPPAIDRLAIRQAGEPGGPFADLMAGRADWMWQLTSAQAAEATARPDLAVARVVSMRVVYLSFDAAGRSGPALASPGAPFANAPFARADVRRAVCHAIDRDALAGSVAGGGKPAIAPCAPTQFACDASAAVRYPHDPDRARALLAAAGFPNGFATELITYARREIAEAVAADLAAVGIRATPIVLPASAALERAAAGTTPLFLGSWGSSSINDISAFLPPFFGLGPLDLTRDDALAALIAEAGLTVDPEARRGLYFRAIQTITEAAFFLPLFLDPATYGLSRRLAFRPMPDELPRFYKTAWK